ncbi:hypothetical protein L0Y69_00355 [bacterium]|nr:hypothetical protein [bacterium]
MPKALTLGNGNILVCLDKYAQIHDFYFPHVGLEDHVGEDSVHRIGVYADGRLSWLGNTEWDISVQYMENANASKIIAENSRLEVRLIFNDTVYNEKPILLRRVTVMNLAKRNREIKLFLIKNSIFSNRCAAIRSTMIRRTIALFIMKASAYFL